MTCSNGHIEDDKIVTHWELGGYTRALTNMGYTVAYPVWECEKEVKEKVKEKLEALDTAKRELKAAREAPSEIFEAKLDALNEAAWELGARKVPLEISEAEYAHWSNLFLDPH